MSDKRCATCDSCGPTSGGWSCDHPTVAADMLRRYGHPAGPHVDYDATEPPSWCPGWEPLADTGAE